MADADADAIHFVLELGRALHRYGTPADRLEEALGVVCARLGIESEVFSTPTTIIMSFGAPAELRTRMLRAQTGELDMGKLALVDRLADAVAARELSTAAGVVELHRIVAAPPRFGRVISTIAHVVASAAVATFLGGGLEDLGIVAAIALVIGVLSQYAKRSTDQARVLELVAATLASLAATLVAAWWPAVNASVVTIAALIVMLPGLSLTVAMTELATRHLIAGTARLMSAVIVLLQLAIGVALGEQLAGQLVAVAVGPVLATALPAYVHWIALLFAALGLAIVVQARPSAFGWIVIACITAFVGSQLGTAWLGPQLGVVVGAFALGVLSNAYARWLRRPAQVVLVPAVFILVPGSMGFRGMTSLLSHDTLTGVETVFTMFVVAVSIVAGLLISTAVMSPRRSL